MFSSARSRNVREVCISDRGNSYSVKKSFQLVLVLVCIKTIERDRRTAIS